MISISEHILSVIYNFNLKVYILLKIIVKWIIGSETKVRKISKEITNIVSKMEIIDLFDFMVLFGMKITCMNFEVSFSFVSCH